MAGLLTWYERMRASGNADAALGASVLAVRVAAGSLAKAPCVTVVIDAAGRTRRAPDDKRLALAPDERAWCCHPGPYSADVLPFAGAPELGLRLSFAINDADPREQQQRFDLFLASEGEDAVCVKAVAAQLQAELQRELAQGHLELPPCTLLAEWNAFRQGFNQLAYTRFGLILDDCVPVDLGDQVDYAAILRARAPEAESGGQSAAAHGRPARSAAPMPALQPALQAPAPTDDAALRRPRAMAESDARAMRRLFLELPALSCSLRMAVLPAGQALFRQHQQLLQRLDLITLGIDTMPAFALAAPNLPLAAPLQARRAQHSAMAAAALDEAWALLARVQQAAPAALPALFEDAERILANLEHASAERRAGA